MFLGRCTTTFSSRLLNRDLEEIPVNSGQDQLFILGTSSGFWQWQCAVNLTGGLQAGELPVTWVDVIRSFRLRRHDSAGLLPGSGGSEYCMVNKLESCKVSKLY